MLASILLLAALAAAPHYDADDERAFMSDYNRSRQSVYSTMDRQDFSQVDVFLGDSIFDRMVAANVVAHPVNMAIAGNFTLGVCRQVTHYPKEIEDAVVVFVHAGTNDAHVLIATKPWTLQDTKDAIDCILAARKGKALVWSGAHHVSTVGSGGPGVPASQVAAWNAMVDTINAYVQSKIASTHGAVFVPSPFTDAELPTKLVDGLHPNPAGYVQWAPFLQAGRSAAITAAQQ